MQKNPKPENQKLFDACKTAIDKQAKPLADKLAAARKERDLLIRQLRDPKKNNDPGTSTRIDELGASIRALQAKVGPIRQLFATMAKNPNKRLTPSSKSVTEQMAEHLGV